MIGPGFGDIAVNGDVFLIDLFPDGVDHYPVVALEGQVFQGIAGHSLAEVEEERLIFPLVAGTDDFRPFQIGVARQPAGNEDDILDAHVVHKGDIATDFCPVFDLQDPVRQIGKVCLDQFRPEDPHVFRRHPAEVFHFILDFPHRRGQSIHGHLLLGIFHVQILQRILDLTHFIGNLRQGTAFLHFLFDIQDLIGKIGAAHLDEFNAQVPHIF